MSAAEIVSFWYDRIDPTSLVPYMHFMLTKTQPGHLVGGPIDAAYLDGYLCRGSKPGELTTHYSKQLCLADIGFPLHSREQVPEFYTYTFLPTGILREDNITRGTSQEVSLDTQDIDTRAGWSGTDVTILTGWGAPITKEADSSALSFWVVAVSNQPTFDPDDGAR